MQKIIRRLVLVVVLLAVTGILPIGESQVSACPNCKAANETDSLKPKAYMYSILFMIGMPAMIFTGFTVSFWRMSRQAQLDFEEQQSEAAAASSDND